MSEIKGDKTTDPIILLGDSPKISIKGYKELSTSTVKYIFKFTLPINDKNNSLKEYQLSKVISAKKDNTFVYRYEFKKQMQEILFEANGSVTTHFVTREEARALWYSLIKDCFRQKDGNINNPLWLNL
jgi:hypothetical protein